MNTPQIDYILTLDDVLKITSLSRSTVYRMIDAGTMPRPIRVGARRMGWRTSAITAWLEQKYGTKNEAK